MRRSVAALGRVIRAGFAVRWGFMARSVFSTRPAGPPSSEDNISH